MIFLNERTSMFDERKDSNTHGVASTGKNEIMVPKAAFLKVNNIDLGVETSSSGMGDADGLVTYKRRRDVNLSEHGKACSTSECYFIKQSMEQFLDPSNSIQRRFKDLTTPFNNYTLKHHRDIILEQICQSLKDEGGLKEIIQHAIVSCTGFHRSSITEGSSDSGEDFSKFPSQTETTCNGLANEAKGSGGVPSSGSGNELNHSSVTELCRSTIFDIIVSENFSQLCSLFVENFQGIKADKLLDLHHINLRLKDNTYESYPMLFHSDIQQVWMKLQKFGTDMIALAKFLSEKSSISLQEQAGSSPHNILENGRCEEFYTRTKLERADGRSRDEVHTCRHCGEKAHGRSCLVCDSCEEMYHISCVEPAVKEIPLRSWYCVNCTAKSIESPHVNCIVCERLNAFGTPIDGNEETNLLYEGNVEELAGNSNELVEEGGCQRFTFCKICRSEIKKDEEPRICGHSFCLHKFYHAKCLTSRQLISYGPCWYCPSCLCRTCFTDRDDDKIVLCDGCDHAYHTYCMHPPRSTIPKGKWFCQKCSAGIQCIRKAKRLHKTKPNMSTKGSLDGKVERTKQKSGGVDMLLNAAKTLNYEENLATMGLKIK